MPPRLKLCMNYQLLKRGASGVALAAVVTLLGACATSPVVSQSTERDTAAHKRLQASAPPQRDSSGPVPYTWITPSGNIPVDVIHDLPFDLL